MGLMMRTVEINLKKYNDALMNESLVELRGRVSKVIGLTIESVGPYVNIGELCVIKSRTQKDDIVAEVVGFKDDKVLLMPLGDINGIAPESSIVALSETLKVPVGKGLLGRVIDGLGNPIDGKGPIEFDGYTSIYNDSPDPLTRNRIQTQLEMGVKAIDGLLTIGRGQRIGIFAGSGVGKSTLLGMISRNALSDVNVIALIGERGREVREFIEKDLQEEGLKRSVVVVATSDKPALIRLKGAMTATAIAEYFREQGKDVTLLMDSLTRFAMAQREVGLAIGEVPVSRGYTPSVFAVMPKLLERAGTSSKGSITGLYTVLVDGDDFNEPVTDTVRGILDGHIMLSRKLASRNHYPAIDVLASVSRVMSDIVSKEHKQMANEIKKIMAVYRDAEDLINIGAYVNGSNENIDYAIRKIEAINEFLTQKTDEKFSFDEVYEKMKEIIL
jgi:flagellum-specific ATP synthase